MSIDDFIASISGDSPPDDLIPALRALWFEKKGDWDSAHETVQEEEGRDAAWVHAYLHRREGDDSNAAYWYSRAGRSPFRGKLDEEWKAIVEELLSSKG